VRLLFASFAAFLIAASTPACFAVSPDLPKPGVHRPTILHDSVQPPADRVLTEWPSDGTFVVPVALDDPGQSFQYDLFVDYEGPSSTPTIEPTVVQPTFADAGVVVVSFFLDKNARELEPSSCHHIEFLVASAFSADSPHTPDDVGGDSVTWLYNGTGSAFGCAPFDAGAPSDAGMPSDADAASNADAAGDVDGPPDGAQTPESGGLPTGSD
jgi:hypothetical protein